MPPPTKHISLSDPHVSLKGICFPKGPKISSVSSGLAWESSYVPIPCFFTLYTISNSLGIGSLNIEDKRKGISKRKKAPSLKYL